MRHKDLDPEARRAYQRAATKRSSQKLRREAMEALGGVECRRCGFDDIRALQVDHVNGGGALEVRNGGGAWRLYRDIRDGIVDRSKYQVLCANCNWIKRTEESEHGPAYAARCRLS